MIRGGLHDGLEALDRVLMLPQSNGGGTNVVENFEARLG